MDFMKALILSLFVSMFALPAKSATLTIRFKSMTEARGQVMWAMYKPGSNFPKEGASSYGGKAPVGANDITIRVKDIPYGTYAIAAIHDVNGNGKMDYRLGFYPLEPIGFSNGARPSISGAPSFEKSKFEFTDESQVIVIDLLKI